MNHKLAGNNKIVSCYPLIIIFSFLLNGLQLAAQSKIEKPISIVFIGNSITSGAGFKNPATQAPPFHTINYLKHEKGVLHVEFSNQGNNGATTLDYLPSGQIFERVVKASNELMRKEGYQLIFSINLGTNDCAIFGPNGSPVSAETYKKNLRTIINKLLEHYPFCKIVLHRPTWFSPNTMYNPREQYPGAQYLEEGLIRLQSYFPEIDSLVSDYKVNNPGHVFRGDTKAFKYFKSNYAKWLRPEKAERGTFYLHPNEQGAVILGKYWAKAIWKAL